MRLRAWAPGSAYYKPSSSELDALCAHFVLRSINAGIEDVTHASEVA